MDVHIKPRSSNHGKQLPFAQAPIWKSSSGSYSYSPLDPSGQQIRLFKISVNPNGEAEGHLRHFDLAEVRHFTELNTSHTSRTAFRPLSYTWGPPAPCIDITIDSKAFSVRRNLFSFLRLLSQVYRDEYFWIDQLCINQADTVERSKQVNMMCDIYKGADVVVWLGDADIGTDAALDEIETWAEQPWQKLSAIMFEALSDEVERAIIEILRREYWARLWIVQELILARDITFHIGHRRMARRTFGDGLWKIWTASNRVSRLVRPKARPIVTCLSKLPDLVRGIMFINDDTGSDTAYPLTLSDAINKYARQQCSDRRDKVYGVQALVLPQQRLVVDYSKPLNVVFEDVLKAAIRHRDVAKNWTYLGKIDTYYTMPYATRVAEALLGASGASGSMNYLRALEWSHGVLCVIVDLPMMRVSEIWQVWSELWQNVLQSAVSPMQKSLGTELHQRSHDIEKKFQNDPQWIKCNAYLDEDAGRPFYEQLKDAVRMMIEDTSRNCGFTIVDEFLVHPDESPLSKMSAMLGP